MYTIWQLFACLTLSSDLLILVCVCASRFGSDVICAKVINWHLHSYFQFACALNATNLYFGSGGAEVRVPGPEFTSAEINMRVSSEMEHGTVEHVRESVPFQFRRIVDTPTR